MDYRKDRLCIFLNKNKLNKANSFPLILFDDIYAAKLSNMGYEDSISSSKNIAKKSMEAYKINKTSDIGIVMGSKVFTVPLGAEFKQYKEGPPAIVKHPISSIEEWSSLDFSKVLSKDNEEFNKIYDAIVIIQENLEDTTIRLAMSCSFTVLSNLIGPENLLRSLRKRKSQVHKALKEITSIQKEIIKRLINIDNLYFHLSDPMASGSLIGNKMYKEYPLNYTKSLVDLIHSYSRPVILHICGDTSSILEEMIGTGVDGLSFDQIMDMRDLADRIGDKVTLIGNLDPVELLQDSNPKIVKEKVNDLLTMAKDLELSFILAPGCDMTYGIPVENVRAVIEEINDFRNRGD